MAQTWSLESPVISSGETHGPKQASKNPVWDFGYESGRVWIDWASPRGAAADNPKERGAKGVEGNNIRMASPIPQDSAKPAAIVLHEITKVLVQASFNGVPFPHTQSPSFLPPHAECRAPPPVATFQNKTTRVSVWGNKSLQRETLLSYWQT